MKKLTTIIAAASLLLAAACTTTEPSARVVVSAPAEDAVTFSDDVIGVSYESAMLVPHEGKYYFTDKNEALIRLFNTIGIKSIRIGGNSTDNPTNPLPDIPDIDEFFGFVAKTQAKVIYSVRLKDGDPAYGAKVAGHIWKNYRDRLAYFAIGNEPSYYKDFEGQMRPHWGGIYEEMKKVAPGAPFVAPDDNPNPPLSDWMLDNFGAPQGPVSLLTMHYYPGDCAYTNPFKVKDPSELIPFDPAVKIDMLLSDDMHPRYESVYERMDSVFARCPYRLSETNSIWYGGLKGASDSYASTLWALDYMWWWSSHKCTGFNFHTGDRVGGGNGTVVSRYALFVSEGDGFEIRPICYAIKAFSDMAKGRIAGVAMDGSTAQLSAYACEDGGKYTVTIINKEHSAEAQPREIEVALDGLQAAGNAKVKFIEGPDVAALGGVTLGGYKIDPDGEWEDAWKGSDPDGAPVKVRSNALRVKLAPATAAIITVNVR